MKTNLFATDLFMYSISSKDVSELSEMHFLIAEE